MQKLFFLLASLLMLSCNGKNKIDLSKTYEGKMTYITARIADHINRRDTSVFENFLVVLDDGAFRRYAFRNKGCDGAYTIKDDVFTAKTEDCECMCNCDPEIGCIGDLILGSYDVIEFTADRFVLESYFENNIGGVYGTYIVEKFVELERQ